MTVIAWDGNILAADRQCNVGDTIYSVRKLWPLDGGGAIAATGQHDVALIMKRWWEEGADKTKWPECQKDKDNWTLLIIALPGKPVIYYERFPEPIEVIDPFSAWGCGREAALGAMAMGADAIMAVEIASKYVTACGRGCDSVRIKDVVISIPGIENKQKLTQFSAVRGY